MSERVNIFLSYAREDEEFARKLVADLRAAGPFMVWLDVIELKVGQDWAKEIANAIRAADYLLVLISTASLQSKWVIQEAAAASKLGKNRVVPVLIEDGVQNDVPSFLAEVQWLDLTNPEDYAINLRGFIIQAQKTLSSLSSERPPIESLSHEPSSKPAGQTPRPRMEEIINIADLADRIADKVLYQINKGQDPQSSDIPRKPTAKQTDNISKLVFVAMSFAEDMDPIYEGIKEAAASVGLEAKRVKDVVGDYKINDKIIELIETSCMIVVDLTHERTNVYFELGYARGLGKIVITTARKDTTLSFDVQGWTCTFYSDSRILEKSLKERFKVEWDRLANLMSDA